MFAEFHFEVIKAEAEQSLLCRKTELKKENSPVEKFRKQLFRGYGLARVPAESPDKTSKTSKTRRKKLHVGAKLN